MGIERVVEEVEEFEEGVLVGVGRRDFEVGEGGSEGPRRVLFFFRGKNLGRVRDLATVVLFSKTG